MDYRTQIHSTESVIVGSTPIISRIREQMPFFANTDRPTLIQGESGTGKSLISRSILKCYLKEKRGHVVIINGKRMGRFYDEDLLYYLIQSLMNKHYKLEDILTSLQTSDVIDYFQIFPETSFQYNQEDIIFIFEDIDLFPDTTQRICLNIFTQTLRAEKRVKVIATTEADEWWTVIRPDLYYQLKGLVIEIPPLRSRTPDIPDLARFFLKQVSNGHQPEIHPSAMDRLQRYYWPGNVEELKREIISAKRRCDTGKHIKTYHLSPNILVQPQLESTREGLLIPPDQIVSMTQYIQLGMMAYHVIHELKGPLTGLLGMTDYFVEMGKTPTHNDLVRLRDEALRMRQLLGAFLGFRQSDFDTQAKTTLSDVVDDVIMHLRTTLDPRISDFINLSGDTPLNRVKGRIKFLKFVFINLIQNAYQAFDFENKKLSIEIQYAVENNVLHISISDNGPGIPEKHLKKIFQPFFSMNKHRNGSGIGLATCQFLIESAGGLITASNRREGGAKFEIEVPL